MEDLTQIVEDSIQDATTPELAPDTQLDSASPDPAPALTDSMPTEPAPDSALASSTPPAPGEDKFAKDNNLPPQRPGERENRIPYSRVKSIVENANKKVLEPLTKELGEFRTKVSDYEARLSKVAEFENILANDPVKFLNMLATVPAYKQLFDARFSPPTPPVAQPDPTAEMPQPDEVLPDGSKVYSMKGFQALQAWQAQQIETKVASQFNKRIEPFEQERARQEHMAKLIPQINAQIEEARKWPLFTDNEEAIVKALDANRSLSLEGAYRQVVFPKIKTDRETLRAELLAEIQKAPRSTSPNPSALRPGASPATSGPRSMSDIVADSIRDLPR